MLSEKPQRYGKIQTKGAARPDGSLKYMMNKTKGRICL